MYDLPIYQACMKIGKKDFNKFLDKFIVLAEKDLQTTKLLLQKGDAKICIKYSKLEHLVSHLQLILDVNDMNQEIFSIEKRFFFIFIVKKRQILFQNSMKIFLRIFFEVLHIYVAQKMKILETWPIF